MRWSALATTATSQRPWQRCGLRPSKDFARRAGRRVAAGFPRRSRLAQARPRRLRDHRLVSGPGRLLFAGSGVVLVAIAVATVIARRQLGIPSRTSRGRAPRTTSRGLRHRASRRRNPRPGIARLGRACRPCAHLARGLERIRKRGIRSRGQSDRRIRIRTPQWRGRRGDSRPRPPRDRTLRRDRTARRTRRRRRRLGRGLCRSPRRAWHRPALDDEIRKTRGCELRAADPERQARRRARCLLGDRRGPHAPRGDRRHHRAHRHRERKAARLAGANRRPARSALRPPKRKPR